MKFSVSRLSMLRIDDSQQIWYMIGCLSESGGDTTKAFSEKSGVLWKKKKKPQYLDKGPFNVEPDVSMGWQKLLYLLFIRKIFTEQPRNWASDRYFWSRKAQAAKLVTTVYDCSLTFIGVKSLDIFDETLGKCPSMFVATKYRCFGGCVGTSPSPNQMFLSISTCSKKKKKHSKNKKCPHRCPCAR